MAAYRGILSCVVCCDGREAPWAVLDCGHVFHQPCVAEWLKAKKPAACPMCRARTRGTRQLLGVENSVDATDDAGLAAHIAERERDLGESARRSEARARDAEARTEAVQAACAAFEAAAQRAEWSLTKAKAKLLTAAERWVPTRGGALPPLLGSLVFEGTDSTTATALWLRSPTPVTCPDRREAVLSARLAEAAAREVALRQELHSAGERHATEAQRFKRRLQEAEFAASEAKRRYTALQLSSRLLTLDQANSLLQGEEVRGRWGVVAGAVLGRPLRQGRTHRVRHLLAPRCQASSPRALDNSRCSCR